MTAVGDLLDAARERTGLPSDNALAARIGIQRQLLSKARQGEKPLPDERIAQICALAKLDGPTWIALIHAERATSSTERALWKLMLDRMGAAAAVVALLCVSLPGVAHAKPIEINGLHESSAHILYIMSTKRMPATASQPWLIPAPLPTATLGTDLLPPIRDLPHGLPANTRQARPLRFGTTQRR